MSNLNVLEYLSRKDKWYLGGGNRLIWTPPFPRFLDFPGFWDPAQYYNYPLAPVFTVSLLDEKGQEIPLQFVERDWQPDRLVQRYQTPADLIITERKFLLPNDCLASEITIENLSGKAKQIQLVLWTVQESFPSQEDNFLSEVQYKEGQIVFKKHLRYRQQPVVYPFACALGMNRKVKSHDINLSEGSIQSPRWDYTPFYEQIERGKLNNEINLAGIDADGLVYLGLHTEIKIGSKSRESVTAAFSAAESIKEASGALATAMKQKSPLKSGEQHWSDYFAALPHFECDDPHLQKYYWYRWYGLRLFTIRGGEGNYPYSAICEGLSSFRVPITYSAQCHILETRWMENPRIGQGSLLNFLHNQKEDGNFIGHVYPRWLHEESFYHANWANIWELNHLHPDDIFLKRAYDGLKKYLEYFDRERDRENSGLFDIQNHYETGQEYMHRYVAVDERADGIHWGDVFRLKGVDVTVYIYEIKKMMARLAEKFGKAEEAQHWREGAAKTKEAVLREMWDPELEMFSDIDPRGWKRTAVKAGVCFYPYFTDMVDESHLPGLKKHLLNPGEFWTPYPAPSSSINDAYFDAEARWKGKRMNCPWNGRVWPMTNSHLAEALAVSAIRFDDGELKAKTVEFIDKFIKMMFYEGDPDRPNCYEHYNPFNGKACIYRGVDDYQHSWVVELIIKYLCGIRPQADGIIVEPLPFPVEHFIIDRVPLCGRRVKVERSGDTFSVWIDGIWQAEATIGKRIEIKG
jgi:hypothetical protein